MQYVVFINIEVGSHVLFEIQFLAGLTNGLLKGSRDYSTVQLRGSRDYSTVQLRDSGDYSTVQLRGSREYFGG